MVSTITRTLTGLCVAAASTMVLAAAAWQQPEEPVDPRILAYDKGPNKIDVSKYPKDMQARYKVFASKCVKCHTLARPINCEFALDDEWERYVKRMMNKSGTLISADEGRQVFEFLAYDSKTRKKALYEKKLKEAAQP